MSDYLSTLLTRNQPDGRQVRPRTAALFEPRGAAGPTLPAEVEETSAAADAGIRDERPMAARQTRPRPEPPAPAEAQAGPLRPRPAQPQPERPEAPSHGAHAGPPAGTLQPRVEPAPRPVPLEAEARQAVRPAVEPAEQAPTAPAARHDRPAGPRVEVRAVERVVERTAQPMVVERTIVAPAVHPPARRTDPVQPEGDEERADRPAMATQPEGPALVVRPQVAPARASEPPARAGRQASRPPAEPAVQVTIGRIEVRAVTPPARRAAPAKPTRSGPTLSLDDYLRQRQGGER
jgi:hypothetical protein